MPRSFRVEREWVPLKQYLPTELYAQLLDLLQHDIVYQAIVRNHHSGNEADMNALIRDILASWLKNRAVIEKLDGIDQYRNDLIESQRQLRENTHHD